MNIFYCPEAVLNAFVALDETESRHISTVLRKVVDEELYVFDGKGSLFDARISDIGKKQVLVHIVRLVQVEEAKAVHLHIAIAPPKNVERMEWLVEKVTELGADEITPIVCKHSERKDLRIDRIEKIVLSASKQSKRLRVPKLNPVIRFESFVQLDFGESKKYIAYCDDDAPHLKTAYLPGNHAVVMIGPEGDFTKEEVTVAASKDFVAVSLGKNRLRLETAGVYAAAAISLINE